MADEKARRLSRTNTTGPCRAESPQGGESVSAEAQRLRSSGLIAPSAITPCHKRTGMSRGPVHAGQPAYGRPIFSGRAGNQPTISDDLVSCGRGPTPFPGCVRHAAGSGYDARSDDHAAAGVARIAGLPGLCPRRRGDAEWPYPGIAGNHGFGGCGSRGAHPFRRTGQGDGSKNGLRDPAQHHSFRAFP